MSRSPTPPRRLLVPLGLAIVLACEIGGVALATRGVETRPLSAVPSANATRTAATVLARAALETASRAQAETSETSQRRAAAASAFADRRSTTAHLRPGVNRGMLARPSIAATPGVRVVDRTKPAATRATASRSSGSGSRAAPTVRAAHVGRNHVWISSLGINRSVAYFPCTRKEPPANYVYRWGCAGHNNVYLMGHAYGVFKALHDSYIRKRLHKGMTVDYADGSGIVRRYAVIWWKVTPPTTAASWAWAAQSTPSMTLQTCVGSTGQDRLMVRLVQTR
jgi:hypothetical protein